MPSRTSSSTMVMRWCVAVCLFAACVCDSSTIQETTLLTGVTVPSIESTAAANDIGTVPSGADDASTETGTVAGATVVAAAAAAPRGSQLHGGAVAATSLADYGPSTAPASVSTSMSTSTASSGEAGTVTDGGGSSGDVASDEDDDRPLAKIAANISQNLLPLPAGAGAALVKPTKYHYYPHNQHIYLLPECAIQQVCNAVYVRLNWTQPLCACPSRYRDPCSASLNSDDLHTTELVTSGERAAAKRALTLVKTCEPTAEMRACRQPRDWSLLALQNVRTGKSHYLVICRCPDGSALEGPMSHDQPTYASVPGIRVYGMMCVQPDLIRRRGRPLRLSREASRSARRLARIISAAAASAAVGPVTM